MCLWAGVGSEDSKWFGQLHLTLPQSTGVEGRRGEEQERDGILSLPNSSLYE